MLWDGKGEQNQQITRWFRHAEAPMLQRVRLWLCLPGALLVELYQQFFYWPGGWSLYITVMLVQRVITGRYSNENEIWMITVPSGNAQNDRAGHSQAWGQMSQTGVQVWEDRREGTGWPWAPPKMSHQQPQKFRGWQNQFRANRIRSKYLRHSTYSKDSCKCSDTDFKKEYVKACWKA